MRIAVIGGGVAGICAAHALDNAHEVHLFERNDYLGGHTNTRIVVEDGREVPVDTGFIVCNRRNYPCFYRFMEQLQVSLRNSDMSFGYYCERSNFGYTGPRVRDAIRNPRTFLDSGFIKLLVEQRRFNALIRKRLAQGNLPNCSLGDFLEQFKFSPNFYQRYLIPLTAAIWSSSDEGMYSFPLLTFAHFFKNHGMLQFSKIPQWQTVVGGSFSYVKAFESQFQGKISKNTKIRGIQRQDSGVTIALEDRSETFDSLILATHADEALKLLDQPSNMEERLLKCFPYHRNHTVLHRDQSVLPPRRSLWASWNYFHHQDSAAWSPVQINYHMNRLQGLKTRHEYIVSLNQTNRIREDAILYETTYTHPAYTHEGIAAQPQIQSIQGQNRTYFCGSYLGYGFHEDAVASALKVAGLIRGVS
ncbi:MAG: FAD-dependent oxidoreductase [Bdellovibrionales bacterium]|nr:FAD-dependent oxidoreductase [Bdellovibrionales bacterium]